jgi:hypothetical protein
METPSLPTPAAPTTPVVSGAPIAGVEPIETDSDKSSRKAHSGEAERPLGSFKKGTDYVPKTGNYKLHEGEKVVPKDKNMDSMKDKMMESLGGASKKPKKEIKEMVHSKTTNGKHLVVHKHHHPEHHPDETHSLENMEALKAHMEDHAGEPNEGEEPEQGGPPQMTAAPSPEAAPPMAAPGQ